MYSSACRPKVSRLKICLDTFKKHNTRFAWAGGTFFPVVLLFQFFVLAGNRFWFYILLMYLGRVYRLVWATLKTIASSAILDL